MRTETYTHDEREIAEKNLAYLKREEAAIEEEEERLERRIADNNKKVLAAELRLMQPFDAPYQATRTVVDGNDIAEMFTAAISNAPDPFSSRELYKALG